MRTSRTPMRRGVRGDGGGLAAHVPGAHEATRAPRRARAPAELTGQRLDRRHHREPPLRAPRRLPTRGAVSGPLHQRRAAARPARRTGPWRHPLAHRRRRVPSDAPDASVLALARSRTVDRSRSSSPTDRTSLPVPRRSLGSCWGSFWWHSGLPTAQARIATVRHSCPASGLRSFTRRPRVRRRRC